MPDDSRYPIPDPGTPDLTRPLNQISFGEALSEQGQMSATWSPKWREKYDWAMRFTLRPLLFLMVVMLNIWWDINVSRIVWRTGEGRLHLDKTVLVALVTTSMANFIALVVIIAKHLFPRDKTRFEVTFASSLPRYLLHSSYFNHAVPCFPLAFWSALHTDPLPRPASLPTVR